MATSEMTIRNDLVWLASRYVTGELSTEEVAAFEARLESDVAACEAVAHAMELNLAIAAAFESRPVTLANPLPTAVVPSRRTATIITALAATAAGVTLMIGYDSPTNGLAHKDGADRLVAAWASGEAARNNVDDDETFEVADDADLDPPDWMLAALTAEVVKEKLPGNDAVREN